MPKPVQQLAAFVRLVFVTVVNTVLLLVVYATGITLSFLLAKLLNIDLGFGEGGGKSRWQPFEKTRPDKSYYRQF